MNQINYEFKGNYSYNELMDALDELTKLRYIQGKNIWTCLLRNGKDAADCFYNQSHGELTLSITPRDQLFSTDLIIHSIDDGAIVLLGPTELFEKAQRRCDILKECITKWGGWIPTFEQVQNASIASGTYWNR